MFFIITLEPLLKNQHQHHHEDHLKVISSQVVEGAQLKIPLTGNSLNAKISEAFGSGQVTGIV